MSSQEPVTVTRLGPGDEGVVLAGADLFDSPPTRAWTARYLSSQGHHLLVAACGERPVGFVTGVETTHPDKGTEMFLYELSVHEEHRTRGVGRALVRPWPSSHAPAAATACGWRRTPRTPPPWPPTARPAPSRPSRA